MGENNEDKIDYLEVDDSVPGQNYVCLSFVSPESMIESKESFKVAKFLQSVCKDKDMDFKKVMEQYNDFTYKFQDELQKDFDEQNDFKTNIRGLKVRGVYNTRDEADKRAKKLQLVDSDFHVFVGQVGYWLPWDPCADKIEDESFINSQLNDMMEKYKENNLNKDMFYEEQKREKIKAARDEVMRKKKEEAASKKLEDLSETIDEGQDDETPETITEIVGEGKVDSIPEQEPSSEPESEPSSEPESEPSSEPESEPSSEPEPELETNNQIDEGLKTSLEDVDPWMARKM
jgi:hypothetical protein